MRIQLVSNSLVDTRAGADLIKYSGVASDGELTDIEHKFWVDIMGSVGVDMSLVIKELYPKGEVLVGLANR